MDSNAFAMFSGGALLCLLPFFWTLPGPGEEIGGTEEGGVDLAASASSAGTLYSGLHRQVDPEQVKGYRARGRGTTNLWVCGP